MWTTSIFLIFPVPNVGANQYLVKTLPSKSRILCEMPKNTLIWPKSAQKGIIDVKYIYFPYLTGPKGWRQSVFGRNITLKSRIFWEMPMNTLIWPKSAEIGDIDVKYIYFPFNFGPKCWGQSVFGHNITLKISNILGDAQEYPNLAKISWNEGYWCKIHLFLPISPVQNVSANQYLAKKLPS